MEFSVLNHPLKSTAHPIILGIFADGTLTSSGEELNAASQNLIRKVFDVSVLKKAGETSTLFYPQGLATTCLILVALGEKGKLTAKEILTSTRAAFQQVFQHQFSQVVCTLQEALPCAEAISRTIIDSSYRYTQTFGPQNTKKPVALTSVQFTETATTSEALQQGNIIGRAINYAKELGNLPGNICTPTYLAQEAQSIAARHTHNMHIEIFDRAGIEALQMGAFLAVAQGSKEEPRLMVLRYQGHPQSETAPYVLVGKGLTFDAGGISIKPAASMDEMKYDMCGAATVLAVLQAVADLQLPINLIGVIPSCENLPSGTAYKPGDILTSMSGQTIEITNTDAEGRLILCDALTYVERLNPHCVIDIATLTGACITALGHHHSGLFGTHPETIQDLVEAGKRAHDTVWHMPLDEDYQQQLQSNFADMVNSAGAPAGAITAASFLARFTKKYTWAHLDIAGTAWKSGKDKGGTGRPVGLLIEFLRQRATSSK